MLTGRIDTYSLTKSDIGPVYSTACCFKSRVVPQELEKSTFR